MQCLIDSFNNYNIIDEKEELIYSASSIIKKFGEMRVINKATERYMRYIDGIDVWQVGDISYDYIHDNIKTYLSIPTIPENIQIKIKWMEIIDSQINDALN